MDFILGDHVSDDPAGDLGHAIVEARRIVSSRGGRLSVVASICGTELDPQDLGMQTQILEEAGAIVFQSSLNAAVSCRAIRQELGSR